MMRYIKIVLGLAMVSTLHAGTDCQKKLELLDNSEKAYESMKRTGAPGSEVINRFVTSGEQIMLECSSQLTYDRRYVLKRKLAEAKELHGSYRSAPPFGSQRERYQQGVIKTH